MTATLNDADDGIPRISRCVSGEEVLDVVRWSDGRLVVGRTQLERRPAVGAILNPTPPPLLEAHRQPRLRRSRAGWPVI